MNFDVTVNGQALLDEGFVGNNTVEGLGLLTFGFIWPCAGIWGPGCENITTTWSVEIPANIEECF
jgi:hypothetical protein